MPIGALLLLGACGGDGGGSAAPAPSVPAPPAPNRAPTAVEAIPQQVVRVDDAPATLDVAPYFSDPDGDSLTYSASSADPEVATVSVSASTLTITAAAPGQVEISVSARDRQGGSATLSFALTVEVSALAVGDGTLSGTVRDGRKRGPVLAGVPVWVDGRRVEAVRTGPDGQYRLTDLSGTVSVSVAADGYLPRTVEIDVEVNRTLDLVLEHRGRPPYAGTAYITPRMISRSDPTSLISVTYTGRADRSVFDRRVGSFETISVFLFEVEYADRVVDFEVNPEFGSADAARLHVDRYAAPLGRLPAELLARLHDFEIHGGDELAGGNPVIRHILIHTVEGRRLLRDGVLEEVLMHEAVHAGLDDAHAASPGWREAQREDGVFISRYARSLPEVEDLAESFGPWFALRYVPERLTAEERWDIATTIPNRLAYLDEQGFDMSPYTLATPTVTSARQAR